MTRHPIHLAARLPLLLAAALLSGCSGLLAPAPTATATASSTLLPSPTASPTYTPTNTPLPSATVTPTLKPSPTSTNTPEPPTPTATASQTSTPAAFDPDTNPYVYVYYILLNTGGPAACGDSLIQFSTGIPRSGDIATDVLNGMRSLLANKSEYFGNVYNPLYASSLNIDRVEFDDSTGYVWVYMTGSLERSGDPCDNTRIKLMVWQVGRQFSEVRKVKAFINDAHFIDYVANDK
jgi:hypothetical protein